ncbi:hypothetical protein FFWV33_07850 [Flavobacterium faecale]|uniref:Uncharacterized protein n=1 Tax=Flavobacterium faecale TaxID=1355330 RepID=A0A2S1LCI3_9FLAO|nr:hypothetical protein [Flavobacterium faecale]AWG21452.1 hypothetical protein FFWV33_07850 [Flavobacterium faecale]
MKERKCILFCHYGYSEYLIYTLKQVKLTNPDCRIILLGDKDNRKIAIKANVEHFFFKDYEKSDELLEFEKIYHHVAGVKHNKEFWTKFVFKRWFYIHNFIKENSIDSFWHFDSDNMILANLEFQECKFKEFDCTEQCSGICLNGYVSSFNIVDGYVKKINYLFGDKDYLNKQRIDFVSNPDFAFTEMRAYIAFKEQEGIKSIRLNKIIDNESFDDCICHAQGYDVYDRQLGGRLLKKIYVDNFGNFYCFHIKSSNYIKMNSLNLSWVPTRLFKLVFQESNKIHKKESTLNFKEYKLLDIFQTKSFRSRVLKFTPEIVKKFIRGILNKNQRTYL